MQLTITEATDLAVRALVRAGMSMESAGITANHLVDAALCGHEFSSLPRVLALAEALRDKSPARATRSASGSVGTSIVSLIVNVTSVVTFGEALRKIGYDGKEPVGGRKVGAFFEAHIEQGKSLEDRNLKIGVGHGATKLFQGHVFAGHRLDDIRAGDEHVTGLVHHEEHLWRKSASARCTVY